MNLAVEQKIAGVLAPLFALRTENDLGIGDLEALRQFVDWAAEIGFRLVQLLPINEMGGDHSPYNAISAVALEPARFIWRRGRRQISRRTTSTRWFASSISRSSGKGP